MDVSYVLIIVLVSYVLGALTKLKWEVIPNRFIPLQNVIVGFLSAFICYFFKIEANLLQAVVLCLMASMASGGTADLVSKLKKGE